MALIKVLWFRFVYVLGAGLRPLRPAGEGNKVDAGGSTSHLLLLGTGEAWEQVWQGRGGILPLLLEKILPV